MVYPLVFVLQINAFHSCFVVSGTRFGSSSIMTALIIIYFGYIDTLENNRIVILNIQYI